MAQRTQLYLDESQYGYLKELARAEGKSIAKIIREWIDEKRQQRLTKQYEKDPLFGARSLFRSNHADMGRRFDDYLYGSKK